MMNVGNETLNQVMNRWAANFRAAQATKVLNEANIEKMNLFPLTVDETAILREIAPRRVDSAEFA